LRKKAVFNAENLTSSQ